MCLSAVTGTSASARSSPILTKAPVVPHCRATRVLSLGRIAPASSHERKRFALVHFVSAQVRSPLPAQRPPSPRPRLAWPTMEDTCESFTGQSRNSKTWRDGNSAPSPIYCSSSCKFASQARSSAITYSSVWRTSGACKRGGERWRAITIAPHTALLSLDPARHAPVCAARRRAYRRTRTRVKIVNLSRCNTFEIAFSLPKTDNEPFPRSPFIRNGRPQNRGVTQFRQPTGYRRFRGLTSLMRARECPAQPRRAAHAFGGGDGAASGIVR